MRDNFYKTLHVFLKLLRSKVTVTGADAFLMNHPNEGSMLAYTDALNHFKIKNAAIKITIDDLKDLPTPLITLLNTDGGTFTIIKAVEEKHIVLLDQHKGWVKKKLDKFGENWSEVVLFAETDKDSGEKDYRAKRRAEILGNLRAPMAICLATVLIVSPIFYVPVQDTLVYGLVSLKLIGMLFTSLLFIHSIGGTNGLTRKLCAAGPKMGCQSILDGPAAKITPWFSWADAGLIYFFGTFLSLFLFLGSNGLENFLGFQLVLSAFAIVFAFYSIYHQGIRAKIWCTLCLSVIFVFILEAVLVIQSLPLGKLPYDIDSLPNLFLGFSAPITFLLLFKNTSIQAGESRAIKKELTRLKAHPKIFRCLLAEQPKMPPLAQDIPCLLLGNKAAEHTITLVSNPLCSPCAHVHKKITKLLKDNGDVNCKLVFLSNTDHNDSGGRFVRKIFGIPQKLQAEALDIWFERNDQNFEKWNRPYKGYPEPKNAKRFQEAHRNWANAAQIKKTPTLFLNGRMLPEIIKAEDLSTVLGFINSPILDHGFANHPL